MYLKQNLDTHSKVSCFGGVLSIFLVNVVCKPWTGFFFHFLGTFWTYIIQLFGIHGSWIGAAQRGCNGR